MSNATRKSGCMCGAVETKITGDPAMMVFCHCDSCRSWLSAPLHAAALWPTPSVEVTKGEEKLAVYEKTEASRRHFCTVCGSAVLIRHPAIGLTDIPAGTVSGLVYAPTMHVNYGEKVLTVRDGLPKFKDFPADFGGSGETLPE